MTAAEMVAGEIGITAPVATGAATIVAGKLHYGGKVFSLTRHHLFPEGATWASLAKQLNLNVAVFGQYCDGLSEQFLTSPH
jgi:hypothetical protein